MLKVYICPTCYNFRLVSKRSKAYCLHCNHSLVPCNMTYVTYSNLNDEERGQYRAYLKTKKINLQSVQKTESQVES